MKKKESKDKQVNHINELPSLKLSISQHLAGQVIEEVQLVSSQQDLHQCILGLLNLIDVKRRIEKDKGGKLK